MFSRSNSIIGATLILLVFALWGISQLRVFHDLEAFFPHTDTDLDFYETHRQRFGADDNFILIGLVRQQGIFDSLFLQKIDQLTKALDTLPNTENVSSLTNLKDVLYTSFGAVPVSMLHIDEPIKYAADSTKIMQDARLLGRYVSKNTRTTAILIQHKYPMEDKEMFALNEQVRNTVAQFDFSGKGEALHIAGRAAATPVLVNAINEEFVFYSIMATLLTIVVMALLLQRFWGIAITAVSVVLGLIFFMGILGATGKPLDVMSPLFPTLMIVVGMSDVIHILSKYLDEINKGKNKRKALKITIREIGVATLLTSVTTAVGFLSLYTANIVAIKSFGLYAALGVMVAYLTVLFFTTAIIIKFRPQQLANLKQHSHFWNRLMLKNYQLVRDHKKMILGISLFILVVCFFGISKISTNSVLLDDMPINNTIRSDFQFFEEHLSGVRTFEMAILAQDNHQMDGLSVLQEVEKLETFLQTIPEIGTLYSPVMLYKSLHKSNNGNRFSFYQLPENEQIIKKYTRQIKKANKGKSAGFANRLISEDKKHGRMAGNIVDVGSDNIKAIHERIDTWIAANIRADVVQFRITGTGLLVDKNHTYLRESLFTGLGLAFLVVSLIMALLFRNVKMVFISLIPNVFPLLVAGAIMGFSGISLKASTAIIFTIAFGIAVDDTIHFLSKFKLQLDKGSTIDTAIRTTFLETGKALCLTTIILFIGFMTMISSTFSATFYVGLLVSITLVTALIADLFLLPACIYLIFRT